MHFHDLDLNLLVALDALLEEKSVTRASKRIFVSQSATSGILIKLREYFNDELLRPVGRNMVLTPLAQSLAKPVHDILLQVQHTVAAKAHFQPATSRRKFTIIASGYTTRILMPSVISEAARQAPAVTFELFPMLENPVNLLDRGLVDFTILPTLYALPEHPHEVLFEETHTCVVWKGNELVGNTLTREQFFNLGQVVVRIFPHRPTFVENWIAAGYGLLHKVEVVLPEYDAVCCLVVGTNRVATVLTRAAHFYKESLPIKLFPPPIELPPLHFAAQWHKYQDKDGALLWMRGIFRQAAKNLEKKSFRRPAARRSASA